MSNYEYIDSQKNDPAEFNPLWKMCGWLTVSASDFYDWLKRPQSVTAARRDALAARIRPFFTDHDGTYGYRRIHADLAGENASCSPELVAQISGRRVWCHASHAPSGSRPSPMPRRQRTCPTW